MFGMFADPKHKFNQLVTVFKFKICLKTILINSIGIWPKFWFAKPCRIIKVCLPTRFAAAGKLRVKNQSNKCLSALHEPFKLSQLGNVDCLCELRIYYHCCQPSCELTAFNNCKRLQYASGSFIIAVNLTHLELYRWLDCLCCDHSLFWFA